MAEPDALFGPPGPTTVEEGLESAAEILGRVLTDHRPTKTWVLFSGGGDSMVLLDVCHRMGVPVEIMHANTGVGIPEATTHARNVAAGYDLPYHEVHPARPYEQMVLGEWGGLPGPGMHGQVMGELKRKPWMRLLAEHRTRRGEPLALISGIRRAESQRRRRMPETRREGGTMWVSPLLHWSDDMMREYRDGAGLRVSEVAAHLGMSGECLCGSMADQDHRAEEREMIRFFYPAFDARLSSLEGECRARGLSYCEGGSRRPGRDPVNDDVCGGGCTLRQGVLDLAQPVSTSSESP